MNQRAMVAAFEMDLWLSVNAAIDNRIKAIASLERELNIRSIGKHDDGNRCIFQHPDCHSCQSSAVRLRWGLSCRELRDVTYCASVLGSTLQDQPGVAG